ncbi:hypothetical protein [Marilutibacter alkalisoli]|uniref:hypothetical protein n=1 Tax=Marilutibacter alkalisoli TaxID=2591633 RepID=UPI001ABE3BF5|nr:hypothetical protein [Lysobacter alkalisoli]
MSDIILRQIDSVLMERIQRVAQAHGWDLQTALMRLLEQGLYVCEGELARSLNDADAKALQDAIAALESVPSDPGFAQIGRVGESEEAAAPSSGLLSSEGAADNGR